MRGEERTHHDKAKRREERARYEKVPLLRVPAARDVVAEHGVPCVPLRHRPASQQAEPERREQHRHEQPTRAAQKSVPPLVAAAGSRQAVPQAVPPLALPKADLVLRRRVIFVVDAADRGDDDQQHGGRACVRRLARRRTGKRPSPATKRSSEPPPPRETNASISFSAPSPLRNAGVQECER